MLLLVILEMMDLVLSVKTVIVRLLVLFCFGVGRWYHFKKVVINSDSSSVILDFQNNNYCGSCLDGEGFALCWNMLDLLTAVEK